MGVLKILNEEELDMDELIKRRGYVVIWIIDVVLWMYRYMLLYCCGYMYVVM